MGAIVAELATVHEGSYVVRALIQIGGTSFSSGMAIATDVELAEDQAKVRALQAFGISGGISGGISANPQSAPTLYPSYEPLVLDESVSGEDILEQTYAEFSSLSPDLVSQDSSSQAFPLPKDTEFGTEVKATSMSETSIAPTFEPSSLANYAENDYAGNDYAGKPAEFNSTLNLNLEPLPLGYPDSPEAGLPGIELDDVSALQPSIALPPPGLEPNLDPELPPTKPEKSAKRKAEPKLSTEPSTKADASTIAATETPESGDRSNEIARIGVEMKRLSWTTEQGRGYLKRTYGKRSRQELDDIELLDFLRFLEDQPSPSQPLF